MLGLPGASDPVEQIANACVGDSQEDDGKAVGHDQDTVPVLFFVKLDTAFIAVQCILVVLV
jgi:hypothetical protein